MVNYQKMFKIEQIFTKIVTYWVDNQKFGLNKFF